MYLSFLVMMYRCRCEPDVVKALSENLTDWPPLCNFLHPLNREELDVEHGHPLGLQQ